jgi:formate dehydrogenase major subunit
MVVELLLADQPGARGRRMTARRISGTWPSSTASTESRFPKLEAERIPLLDDSHVAMRVNLDACIQCNLCVRACREVQVNDVIGMAGRGHDAYPVVRFRRPMGDSTCVACGECVQACPTGALMPATVLTTRTSGRQRRL